MRSKDTAGEQRRKSSRQKPGPDTCPLDLFLPYRMASSGVCILAALPAGWLSS